MPDPVEVDVETDDEDVMVVLPDAELELVEEPDVETSVVWVVMTGPLAELPGVQFGFCLVTPFSTIVQSLPLKTWVPVLIFAKSWREITWTGMYCGTCL